MSGRGPKYQGNGGRADQAAVGVISSVYREPAHVRRFREILANKVRRVCTPCTTRRRSPVYPAELEVAQRRQIVAQRSPGEGARDPGPPHSRKRRTREEEQAESEIETFEVHSMPGEYHRWQIPAYGDHGETFRIPWQPDWVVASRK